MAVKIIISGEGLSLERDISMHEAGQIITHLGTKQQVIPTDQKSTVLTERSVSEIENPIPSSPKEAISSSGAKTNSEKITTIGKYIQDRNASTTFSSEEVKSTLQKMGEQPANFLRDLKTAEKSQDIYCENKKDDVFSVTDKGLASIDGKFAEKKRFIKQKTKSSAKKTTSPAVVDSAIKNIPITSNLEGFLNFHDLDTKWKKILWLLIFADKNEVEALSSSDVEYLSGKIKGLIARSGFTAHNTPNIKAGYVMKKAGSKFSIEQIGIDFLKTLVKNDESK